MDETGPLTGTPNSTVASHAERTLRRLVEAVQDIVYIITGDNPYEGRVELVSEHVATATGWKAEEFIEDRNLWFGLLHPDDLPSMMESTMRMMASGQPVVRSYRLRHRSGGLRWFDDRVAPIHDTSGKLLGFCGAARDVTALRETQANAILNDRLKALGTLSACLVHELGNPLAALRLHLQALEESLIIDETGVVGSAPAAATDSQSPRGLVLKCNEAANELRAILLDFHGFARDDSMRTVIDPRTTLERALRLVGPALKPFRIVRRLKQVPHVLASEVRLAQVFVNLLINAAHASRSDGVDEEIRVTTSAEAGCAIIEIQDDGVGIAPEALPRIFDAFFTSKPVGAGTGLGLFVAHKIVSDLGGEIEVRSTPGAGSTFRVVLPTAKDVD
jgi:PAS domain S-box-containing protein